MTGLNNGGIGMYFSDIVLFVLCLLYAYFGLIVDSFMQWPIMAAMIIISTIKIYINDI